MYSSRDLCFHFLPCSWRLFLNSTQVGAALCRVGSSIYLLRDRNRFVRVSGTRSRSHRVMLIGTKAHFNPDRVVSVDRLPARTNTTPRKMNCIAANRRISCCRLGPAKFTISSARPMDIAMSAHRNLYLGIAFVPPHQHADPPHGSRLLRVRRQRQRHRTPKPCDELPPSHQSRPSAAL